MSVTTDSKSINTLLKKVELSKPALANKLLETKTKYAWKETTYRSWRGFCNVKVALSNASIYRYVRTAEIFKKFNYTDADVDYMVAGVGWSRFQLGLAKLHEAVAPDVFVDKFKDLNLNERIIFEEKETGLVNFSFSIPKLEAEKLTKALLVRGMRENKSNRTNISGAMANFVNEFCKD